MSEYTKVCIDLKNNKIDILEKIKSFNKFQLKCLIIRFPIEMSNLISTFPKRNTLLVECKGCGDWVEESELSICRYDVLICGYCQTEWGWRDY